MTQTVFVTGASAGIGKALALRYAGQGARLLLIARNVQRLGEVADECRRIGATVTVATVDVRDRKAMAELIETEDARWPIDTVIANAGITHGRPHSALIEPAEGSVALMETNVIGVMNTILPVVPRFIERRRGQIGIISSIAGLIALPDTPSYCASKAAVLMYGRSLRGLLHEHDVGVTVICAGYVTTQMSQRVLGWKPGEITAERAATIIDEALRSNRAVVSFPRYLGAIARIGATLPDALRQPLLAAFRFTVEPAADPGPKVEQCVDHASSSKSST